MNSVGLGFSIRVGDRVTIPITHMAVTGQTQQSGKTTTLEALITRSGRSALAFVTKRGESSFAIGHRVQPYFRDRADWQFVTSIIDATLQEKNKFLRPWIIRICRNTKTLADVQREVRRALQKAKGINEGVYTQLDAYLDMIVPVIQQAHLAMELRLAQPGCLSVMDVSAFPLQMQMLFVQSAIDWINERERGVIVVIPEAWEFVPEGKGSPVKASAIALARKGAALGNFIWVDSQDMAGVDKTILRACTVWLIGVQREANEIKRNLASIPKGVATPKAADLALLGRGEFFACWGHHVVRTYVQPAWLPDGVAQRIARGEMQVDGPALAHYRGDSKKEDVVDEAQARALRKEDEDLREQIADLQRQLAAMEKGTPPRSPEPTIVQPTYPAQMAKEYGDGLDNGKFNPVAAPIGVADFDHLYARIKERALVDQQLIRLMMAVPEIEVTRKRVTIAMDTEKQPGFIAAMIAEGFFDDATPGASVVSELKRRGRSVHNANVYRDLDRLAEQGFLTKEAGGFQCVKGMKINIIEA